jgi:hypothetical protein
MSVYAITGELGTGKSLLCVSKIREALLQGRRVATNLDLKLEHLVGAKRPRDVLRLPDFPKREDLDALGIGCDSYDEKRFGLIVLDEAATFLNARDYRQDGRSDVIKWLLHSRKLRWDVFLIIQDLGMLDKQVRSAFVEHVVKCKRADRIGLPFLSAALSALGFGRVTFPQIHFAIVRYGTGPHAMVVDRWVYIGGPLYAAYDTSQKLIGREIAHGGKVDPKTGEFPVVVLEKSLASMLCPARASWLRRPGLVERFAAWLSRAAEGDGLAARVARFLEPPVGPREAERRVFALMDSGAIDPLTKPASPSFEEWLASTGWRGYVRRPGWVSQVVRGDGLLLQDHRSVNFHEDSPEGCERAA